jgi:hypothetical protein
MYASPHSRWASSELNSCSSPSSVDFRVYTAQRTIGRVVGASHPDYGGTVVYRTASNILTPHKEQVKELVFDSGLKKIGENFAAKMFAAHQKLQTTSTHSLSTFPPRSLPAAGRRQLPAKTLSPWARACKTRKPASSRGRFWL